MQVDPFEWSHVFLKLLRILCVHYVGSQFFNGELMQRLSTLAIVGLALLLPALAQAKGNGTSCSMEGKVTKVTIDGQNIRFEFEGQFRITQWNQDRPSPTELVIDCKAGTSTTVNQGEPFFAMTTNWHGGAIQTAGALARILLAAAERGNVVKFELTDSQLTIGPGAAFGLQNATVIRATDADLK